MFTKQNIKKEKKNLQKKKSKILRANYLSLIKGAEPRDLLAHVQIAKWIK